MRYILCSRGTPIGETELGFRGTFPGTRSGWFVPTAAGERMMPLIASSLALRARLRAAAATPENEILGELELSDSCVLADMAEAAQHQAAMELELRREDGSPIATESIGLQDTEQLIQLARLLEADSEAMADLTDEDWLSTDPLACASLDDIGDMVADDDELVAEWDDLDCDPRADWSPDEIRCPAGERYQIHVMLMNDADVP